MGGYDGEVRIKTSMELRQLEKDIKEAEKMLKQYEKEGEEIESQSNSAYERKNQLLKERNELEKKVEKLRDNIEKRNKREVEDSRLNRIAINKQLIEQEKSSVNPDITTIENAQKVIEMLNKAYEDETRRMIEEAEKYEQKMKDLENTANGVIDSNNEKWQENINNQTEARNRIEQLKQAYQDAKQELIDYNRKLEEQKKHEQEVREIKRSIDKVGNSVKRVTGQMIRWSLSLVGINGIMSLVSRSLTLLKRDNKELNANLNYISFALANAIKPIVEKIVNLVLKLMSYINYIWVKWFGKNLFKDSGAKEYEKSMKNSSKSAKQIKKDLMGFDEVNKLSDNSSSGGDGFVAPSMDLSKIKDIKPPWWVEWIATHKDEILRVIDALISLFVFKKTIQWLLPLSNFFGLFTGGTLAKSIGKVGTTLTSKIGGALKGLLTTSKSIFTGWSGFGIGILASLPIIIATVENAKKKLKETYEYQEKISEQGAKYSKEFVENTNDLVTLNEDLNYRQDQTKEKLAKVNQLGKSIYSEFYKSIGATGSWVKNTNDTLRNADDILAKEIEMYKQGKLTEEQKKELIEMVKKQRELALDVRDAYDEIGIKNQEVNDYVQKYNGFLEEAGINLESLGLGWDGLFPPKKVKIDVEADTSKANHSLGDFIKNIGTKISNLFSKIDLSGFVEKITNGFKKLFPNVKFPNLKSIFAREGGIINNPGRGVQIGQSIIGGEAGAEAILPLDDKTMDRLGQSIARHMSINATMINQMNGRTLSREIHRITNENEFTYNG